MIRVYDKYGNLKVDISNSEMSFGDSASVDAFQRLRVSYPQTIFGSKQLVDNQPLFWDDQEISGSGTTSSYNTNQSSTTISVAHGIAGKRVRQTFGRFNYTPGKSQVLIMTGVFGAAATGIKRKAGLFDNKNGIFFDQQSNGMGVTIRTYTSGSAVDTRIVQQDWNIDKMDGTGPSGITIDYAKNQIWFVDFEWLSAGRVRFGFFLNGLLYYCHQITHLNSITMAYMSIPNLPLRYEIENDGTGFAASFTHICTTVQSEGGTQTTGFPFGISRQSTPLVTLNTSDIFPLFALRLNSSYLSSTIEIIDMHVNCTTNSAFNYYLILNPIVTGTAFSFTHLTNSSIDVDQATTNATVVSGGTILYSGSSQSFNDSAVSQNLNSDFQLGSNINGISDIIVVGVQRITGTAESFYGSINIKDKQ